MTMRFPHLSLPRLVAASLLVLAASAQAAELRFSFSERARAGNAAPLYDEALGYGFVSQTLALPARPVHTATIRASSDGFVISEPAFEAEKNFESLHYNNYGMAFRIAAPPGAYAVRVRTTVGCGRRPPSSVSWAADQPPAGHCLPGTRPACCRNKTTDDRADGRDWRYRYVERARLSSTSRSSRSRSSMSPVGARGDRRCTPIAAWRSAPAGALPTAVHPRRLHGQDLHLRRGADERLGTGAGTPCSMPEVRSGCRTTRMGGRSFSSADAEGRLNDLLLAGYPGDVVLIQFGHNDESDRRGAPLGPGFAPRPCMERTGAAKVYLPAVRARGMIPVLVTPMARVPMATFKPEYRLCRTPSSKRRFPGTDEKDRRSS
jgi:hypothetical protein